MKSMVPFESFDTIASPILHSTLLEIMGTSMPEPDLQHYCQVMFGPALQRLRVR
jgi:hypothetical protein